MRVTRRKALIGALGMVGLGLGGFAIASPHDYVKHVIRSHFAKEKIAEDALELFAVDFFAFRPRWNTLEHRFCGRLGRLVDVTPLKDRWSVRKLREDALTTFILGSNTLTRASTAEPVEYLYFPDPYIAGCVLNWA